MLRKTGGVGAPRAVVASIARYPPRRMATGDELAETAAGPPVAARPAGALPRPGDTVGRYQIDRALGAGGMGVVYAALDPDLDRQVALKLLRRVGDDAPAQARARLLREARAMAKLSHPNVITVYEVGSDGATDFVAMELIDGHSAAEWLAERRTTDEVLRVFLAAGRGLAAAHAGGLIHRDFKPANVLVGRDGRVVVTDFGLARAFDETATPVTGSGPLATGVAGAALGDTLTAGSSTPPPGRAPPAARNDHGSLSNPLTRTGAMLGTPAYMAPEQYLGGAGPRADQFSFCVTLWEALAGARPFRGHTFDELRRAIEAAVPEGEVPRRLRPALLRGLAREPARRFPAMGALLSALERQRRPPRIIAAVLATAMIGGGLVIAAVKNNDAPPAPAGVAAPLACATRDAELAAAWTPAIAARIATRLGDTETSRAVRTSLDGFVTGWRGVWDQTCRQPDAPGLHPRLACLQAARDDLAAMVWWLETTPIDQLRATTPIALLASAEGCWTGRRPLLPPLPGDPALRASIAAVHREVATAGFLARTGKLDRARARIEPVVVDARAVTPYPAALAVALVAQATIEQMDDKTAAAEPLFQEAASVADRAAADGLRATALLGQLECVTGRTSDTSLVRELAATVTIAIERAGGAPALRAGVDLILAAVAADHGDLDQAITLAAGARTAFESAPDARRAGRAANREAGYRWLRNGPGDLARAVELERQALELLRATFGDDHRLTRNQRMSLAWQLTLTRPDEARALFDASLDPAEPVGPGIPTQMFRGRVIDETGRAVAGATVQVGPMLLVGSNGEPYPVSLGPLPPPPRVTTGADGRFEVTTVQESVIVASKGDRRSAPIAGRSRATDVRIVPTGGIAIDLTVTPATAGPTPLLARAARFSPMGLGINYLPDLGFNQMPQRDPSGVWTASGLAGGVRLHLMSAAQSALGYQLVSHTELVPVAGTVTRASLAVDLRGTILDIIVRADRAATLASAQVVVVPGRLTRPPTQVQALRALVYRASRSSVGNARKLDVNTRTDAGAALYRDGDLQGFASVAPGPATVCVVPLGGDVADESFMTSLMWTADNNDLDVRCQVIEVAASPAVQAFVIETPPMRRLRPARPTPPPPGPPPPPPGPPALPESTPPPLPQ